MQPEEKDAFKTPEPFNVDPTNKHIINILTDTTIGILDIENILQDFSSSFRQIIDPKNIAKAVSHLMSIVGKFTHLDGNGKKKVVCEVLLYIVDVTNIGPYDPVFDVILNQTIPIMIDTLVSVENGDIVFNKKVFSYFECFCPCFYNNN